MVKVVFQVVVAGGTVASFPVEQDAIDFARAKNAARKHRFFFTVERSLSVGGKVAI